MAGTGRGPRPKCVIRGEPWWDFGYEYEWEGRTYCFHICARSREEADARLKRLPLARFYGQIDGGPIPALPGAKLYVRLVVWLRNLRQRLAGRRRP
jgi:hypothetical protein